MRLKFLTSEMRKADVVGLVLLVLALTIFWLVESSDRPMLDDELIRQAGPTVSGDSWRRAWPVGRFLISWIASASETPLNDLKKISIALHVFNSVLVLGLLGWRRRIGAVFYFVHPTLYLSLHWPYQVLGFISTTVALAGWLILTRVRYRADWRGFVFYFVGSLFLGLSVLIKPLYGLLLFGALAIGLRRFLFAGTFVDTGRKVLAVVICGVVLSFGWYLGKRVLNLSQEGLFHFPEEYVHYVEFATGHRPDNSVFLEPRLELERMRQEVPEVIVLRRLLYMSESVYRYFVLATGVSFLGGERARPQNFTVTNGFGIVGGVLFLLSFFWSCRLALTPRNEQANGARFAEALFWLLVGWVPVSGLFYLPYMKFDFASPHYFFGMLPGAALLFALAVESLKWRIKMSRLVSSIGWIYLVVIGGYGCVLYRVFGGGPY